MSDFDTFEESFNDFHDVRPMLPAKIVRLRRISQENHVRRIRIARQRKASSDASLLLSPFILKKSSSNFSTPFTTPGGLQNIHAESSNAVKTQKAISSDISPNIPVTVRSKDHHTRYTALREIENSASGSKSNVESDTVIGDSQNESLILQKVLPNKGRRFSHTPPGNEYAGSSSKEKVNSSESQNKNSENLKKRTHEIAATSERTLGSTSYFKNKPYSSEKLKAVTVAGKEGQINFHSPSLGLLNTHETRTDKNQKNGIDSKKNSNISKIPIALWRLSLNTETVSQSLDCTPKPVKNRESNASVFSDKGNVLKESHLKKSPVRLDPLVAEKSAEIPELSICDKTFISKDDLSGKKEKIHASNQQKDFESVSMWLNNIVDSSEDVQNSSSLDEVQLVDNTQPLSSNEKFAHESGKCVDSREFFEGSGAANEQCSSDSEQSAEYHDTEEAEGEILENCRDASEEDWEGSLKDYASTIIIPSDKDLDLETHRESNFQQLPGYPSTPYNLRFPRYMQRYDDSILRSDGKEMDEVLRELESIKRRRLRRKMNATTPKGRKNGKLKKNLKNRNPVKRDLFN